MERVILTVKEIWGDYAILVAPDGRERQTALMLLPDELRDGDRVLFENFEYTIIRD